VAHVTILHLPNSSLVPDPDNPRERYSPEDVAALAESIRSIGGVEQPLLICPDGVPGRYQVVDGHMRLAAAQALGPRAPLLKCELREGLSRKDRLLIMARTSSLFFAKDPISEGKHFRKLIEEEGVTRTDLAREIGRSINLIDSRLELLRLDMEIQDLVASGRLPKDVRIVAAFLSVVDQEVRVRLAQELARRGASVKGVIAACQRVVAGLASQGRDAEITRQQVAGAAPSMALALEDAPPPPLSVPWPVLRAVTASACRTCEVRLEVAARSPEPAWSLVSHASEDTCDACGLSTAKHSCRGCPLPEMLHRLLDACAREAVLMEARGVRAA
jgi:ParB family chromosome partitioning protein